MYFDFEGRNFDTPTVESAISWREQLLLSLFGHLFVVLLILFGPHLPFVRQMAEQRLERMAELQRIEEEALQARLEALAADDDTFVFVQPRVEIEPQEPVRPDAVLSDRDRVAQSPERSFVPDNRLPVAEGNSSELVVTDDAGEGLDPLADPDADPSARDRLPDDRAAADANQDDPRLVDRTDGDGDAGEFPDALSDDPGARPDGAESVATLADSSLSRRGGGPGDPDEASRRREIVPDGLLGQANRSLSRSLRQQTFGNVSGDTGRYGPEIQFDSKGVDFGPWVRRFVAQIRRNWFIPYRVITDSGHVVLTFYVNRDGSLTDLAVLEPSPVDPFNHSAANAIRASNPTQPLPPEYPDDRALFTVTFYFNEVPPGRQSF